MKLRKWTNEQTDAVMIMRGVCESIQLTRSRRGRWSMLADTHALNLARRVTKRLAAAVR